MNINSVKQAIEAGKVTESVLRNSGLNETADHIKILTDTASLVVNAPTMSEKMCIVSKESMHEPSRRRGWNEAIQADRLLWAKRMLEIYNIIDSIPEYPGEMPDKLFRAIKKDKASISEHLRLAVRLTKKECIDAIKKELGVKGCLKYQKSAK